MPTEETVLAMPTRVDELEWLAADAWKEISTQCALLRMPISMYRDQLCPSVEKLIKARTELKMLKS